MFSVPVYVSAGSWGSDVRLILNVSAAVALLTLFAPVIAVVCRRSEEPATPNPALVPLTAVKDPAPTLISNAEDGMFVVPTVGTSAAAALAKYPYKATEVFPGWRTHVVVTVIPALPLLLAAPGVRALEFAVFQVCVELDKPTVNEVLTVAVSATVALFEFVAALAGRLKRTAKVKSAPICINFRT